MEYTKGEWRIERDAQGACMIMHPTQRGKALASLTDTFSPTYGFAYQYPFTEREANAHLIAVAPRMAQLLEVLVNDGWNASVSEEAKEILDTIP